MTSDEIARYILSLPERALRSAAQFAPARPSLTERMLRK
jgi:hypothetical protein